MRAPALVLLLSVGAGCTSKAGGQQAGKTLVPSASVSSAPAGQPVASAANEAAAKDNVVAAFLDANRASDWRTAAARFERLSAAQKADPKLRYARAYGAQRLGDSRRVLELTEDLSKALPLLSSELERMRAEAHFDAGNYKPAADYFSKQTGAEDLLKAARAFTQLREMKDARRTVDRALATAAKQNDAKELLAQIRAARVDIAGQTKQTALVALDL